MAIHTTKFKSFGQKDTGLKHTLKSLPMLELPYSFYHTAKYVCESTTNAVLDHHNITIMSYYMVRMLSTKTRTDFAVLTVLSLFTHIHYEVEIIIDATKSQGSYRFHVFFHRAGGKMLLTSWITVKWEWE